MPWLKKFFLALWKFSDRLSKLFDGMHPTFRQVPPKVPLLSTQAVFKPNCAARIAHTYPPGPPPIQA